MFISSTATNFDANKHPQQFSFSEMLSRIQSIKNSGLIEKAIQKISNDSQTLLSSQMLLMNDSGYKNSLSLKKLNGDEIVEALQSEAVFTNATDKKPIVATYGCGPCVAVGGYDAINKIAFIVHFSNAKEVEEYGESIFYNLSELAKKKIEKPIQIHLRGGIKSSPGSEATIKAIKLWMTRNANLPMEMASEEILSSNFNISGKSLFIDSRNGEVGEYDSKQNPKAREMNELVILSALMSSIYPSIKTRYIPT